MKRTIMNILMCGCIAVALFCCISCNDDLDIHQSYEFTVETMPVPKELAKGESAEIRCTLKRSDELLMRSTPSAISSSTGRVRSA